VPAWRSVPLYSTLPLDSIQLGRYVDARFTPDSSLIVTGVSELLVLSSRGELTRTIGRSGDGPGEYRAINRLAVAADGSLLIGDLGSGRVTVLGPTGNVRRVLPRLGSPTPSHEIDALTLLSDGRIAATYWQQRPNRDAAGIPREGFERDSAPLLTFDSTGEISRLGSWDGLERARVSLDGEPARLAPAFASTAVFHGRGDWVAIGSSDSIDLSVYHDTTLTLRLVFPRHRRTPTAADVRAWEGAVREQYPDVAEMYLKAVEAGPQVPALPTVGAVRLDERGEVWVGAYVVPGTTAREWRVYSPTGAPIGKIEWPARVEAMMSGSSEVLDIFGDRVALLREDESGVPYIEVRRILR
jgi:hypothetical protein